MLSSVTKLFTAGTILPDAVGSLPCISGSYNCERPNASGLLSPNKINVFVESLD